MERLKELRTAQKLTQQQMADYLGVDRTTYVKYETDKSEPTFDTLQKLADYFGVTVDFLMGRDTIEKPAATMDDELNEYLEELKNREDMRMLFSLAKGATKEDFMQAVKIIEALRDKHLHPRRCPSRSCSRGHCKG